VACGHMFNERFDEALIDYNASYENSLLGSPRYKDYTDEIVGRVARIAAAGGRTAVEVGCGRGEFLHLLREHGFSTCVGFDPSRSDEHTVTSDGTVSIIGTVFEPGRAPRADLVCSRHVLEHLPQPLELLRTVRAAFEAAPPQLVFLEVPDGSFTLVALGIWDLIYEHVSYFTQWSLSRALAEARLIPTRVETSFGGQFLLAEARFGGNVQSVPRISPPDHLLNQFETFHRRFDDMITGWEQWLAAVRERRVKLALWGGGSKGVTFLNLLDRGDEHAVSYVIDVNPLKNGAFVAGTGHPIRAPSAAKGDRLDAVLLMNPEYEPEVRRALADLGESIEVIVVSGRMPPKDLPFRRDSTAARDLYCAAI
jgi:hypothetical protein